MKPFLSHLQFNIDQANLGFYKDLLAFLEWKPIFETETMFGAGGANGESIWFIGAAKQVANDYDGPGLNHIGLGAESQADVDAAAAWLAERGVERLFNTPQHRPEFSQGEGQTYYQVMFEGPDRILFEIVYIGARQG